ncbi:hypothetical protein GPALN_012066 [Globodera pallida]|nr:hypothetical protein GPALN_012066 [Globodera pallida]
MGRNIMGFSSSHPMIVLYLSVAIGSPTSMPILPGTKGLRTIRQRTIRLVGWVIYAARKATQSFAAITSAVNGSGVGFPKHRRKQRFWSIPYTLPPGLECC